MTFFLRDWELKVRRGSGGKLGGAEAICDDKWAITNEEGTGFQVGGEHVLVGNGFFYRGCNLDAKDHDSPV